MLNFPIFILLILLNSLTEQGKIFFRNNRQRYNKKKSNFILYLYLIFL
jgi:lipopolysaccharide/colanic/teichoic acid biosynthesis glycosyltransferase